MSKNTTHASSYTNSHSLEGGLVSSKRIDVPIRLRSTDSSSTFYEPPPPVRDDSYSKDTTLQWIRHPINGNEKFRVTINIEGFNKNDVRVYVERSKLFIYGERVENKSQFDSYLNLFIEGTSTKIMEKSYELPADIDTFSSRVTFPSSTLMQIDFSPKSDPSPEHRITKKSNENQQYQGSQNYFIHNQPSTGHRDMTVQTQRPSDDIMQSSSISPHYKTHQLTTTGFPINESQLVSKQTFTETHRETHHHRSSPTTGVQSSHEIEHRRSASPPLLNFNQQSTTLSSFHNTNDSDSSGDESLYFPRDFDKDTFFRSPFQPQIFIDDRHRRYIEMKLNMSNYNPNRIRVCVNDNDLIVQVEQTDFYKKITLPSNIDLSSLTLNYHHDKNLYIIIRLLDEYSSFKYI